MSLTRQLFHDSQSFFHSVLSHSTLFILIEARRNMQTISTKPGPTTSNPLRSSDFERYRHKRRVERLLVRTTPKTWSYQHKSRLLSLPAEILNQIISLALTPEDHNEPLWLNTLRQPPLTLACRQLQTEGLRQFFFENTFRIWLKRVTDRWWTLERCNATTYAWLRRVGKDVTSSFRHVIMATDCIHHDHKDIVKVDLWEDPASSNRKRLRAPWVNHIRDCLISGIEPRHRYGTAHFLAYNLWKYTDYLLHGETMQKCHCFVDGSRLR